MTNSVIKICNFVHYFFREGGYLDCDHFSLMQRIYRDLTLDCKIDQSIVNINLDYVLDRVCTMIY